MLTREQVKQAIEEGQRKSNAFDSRDFLRLSRFFTPEEAQALGISRSSSDVSPWTEEEILSNLRADLDFGFEKALDQRGISSSLMYEVVKMWLWILEDDLQHMEDYKWYGLPLFKAVAVKYGFPDQIEGHDPTDDRFGDSNYD